MRIAPDVRPVPLARSARLRVSAADRSATTWPTTSSVRSRQASTPSGWTRAGTECRTVLSPDPTGSSGRSRSCWHERVARLGRSYSTTALGSPGPRGLLSARDRYAGRAHVRVRAAVDRWRRETRDVGITERAPSPRGNCGKPVPSFCRHSSTGRAEGSCA